MERQNSCGRSTAPPGRRAEAQGMAVVKRPAALPMSPRAVILALFSSWPLVFSAVSFFVSPPFTPLPLPSCVSS